MMCKYNLIATAIFIAERVCKLACLDTVSAHDVLICVVCVCVVLHVFFFSACVLCWVMFFFLSRVVVYVVPAFSNRLCYMNSNI